MNTFFHFPPTPYLAWLGGGDVPRDDKLLSPIEASALLAGEVVVEEKLDGANLGFSLGPNGVLRAQSRGQYLVAPHTGQFARLPAWLAQHGDALCAVLTSDRMLFGEWCAARHSLDYSALPDWFLLFDVYERDARRFWSAARRNTLAGEVGLVVVPQIFRGHTTLAELERMMMHTPSRYRAGLALEGVVVRRESPDGCEARAKLVRPDFTQSISTHWRHRVLQWNRITKGDAATA